MPPLWLEQSGEATFCPRPHVAPCSRARAPFFSLSLKTGIRARKTLAALDKLAPGRNRGDEIEGALATLRLRSEIESTAGGHHAGAAWSRHGPDAQSVRGSLRTWCGLAAARKAQGIRIAGECALEHVIELTGRLRSGSIRSAAEGIDLSPR